MYKTIVVFLIIASVFCQHVTSINILAIISKPLRSHYTAFQSIFRALANKGHRVTIINNFPDDKPVRNMRFVDLQLSYNSTIYARHPLHTYENVNVNIKRISNLDWYIDPKVVLKDCENLFTNDNVKQHYAENHKYDVIFVEQFTSDCDLAYAAAMYEAPIIGITSHVLLPRSYGRLGLSFDISADTFYFSDAGPNPPLLRKVETAFIVLFFNTFVRWRLNRGINDVFKRFLPNYSLDVEKVARERMVMMFVYQHFSISGARVLPPQVVEIGGVHIGTAKPVSQEIEEFLSDATQGAIYVSFGSNLKASTMSDKKLQQFLTAFRRIPQKIIWKFENATFSEQNVLTSSWLPQLDILCHPKVLAFVSHGGMLSLSESTHCGKPLLTIPFFGDQFSNSAAARTIGMGITLFFDKINADNLEAAIKELTSPEKQQTAQRISRLWHDRPMPVMDSAIYWTEYVARHKSAPPSLPSKHNTWFDSMLIDVAICIIIIVMLLGLAVYTILKIIMYILLKIARLFRRSKLKGD